MRFDCAEIKNLCYPCREINIYIQGIEDFLKFTDALRYR